MIIIQYPINIHAHINLEKYINKNLSLCTDHLAYKPIMVQVII